MSNFKLAFNNQADTATLTGSPGSAWDARYPVTNLTNYRLSLKARTSGTPDGSASLRVDLGANFYLQCIGLMAHNLDSSATFRVRVYSDAYFTVAYDSLTQSVYPTGSLPEVAIPSGSSNSGTAKPTATDLKRFQRNLYHFLTAPLQGRYIQIDVFNSTNADGYLQFGRLFVGNVFSPAKNPDWGDVHLKLESRADAGESEDGTPFFYTRKYRMSIAFAWQYMSEDEGMKWMDILALSDINGELLLVWDSSTVAYQFRKQLFGRLKQLDPIDYPSLAGYKAAAEVTNVLQG